MNNAKELFEICEKHPDLPIVPFVDSVVCWGEYSWYMGAFRRVEVGEVACYSDRCFDDREDFKEFFYNYNCNDIDEAFDEAFGDDDEAVEKYLDKVADEHFKKAIIVYIGTID